MPYDIPQIASMLMQVGDVVQGPWSNRKGPALALEGARMNTGGAGRAIPMERPLSQQQRYDEALAQQQGRTTNFEQFSKGFADRIGLYPQVFSSLRGQEIQNTLRNFYRNPEVTLKDLSDLARSSQGNEKIARTWLRQMLEEEFH